MKQSWILNVKKPRSLLPAPRLCVILMLSLLMSCSSVSVKPTPEIKRSVPASALTECPSIPEPQDGKWTTVRRWVDSLIDLYGECRDKHKESVDWVKRGQ